MKKPGCVDWLFHNGVPIVCILTAIELATSLTFAMRMLRSTGRAVSGKK